MIVYSIVVTYNGAQWIEKCFGSLVESQVSNHVILAIDNNSTDGTPDLIRQIFPKVDVIETGSNLGFGKANNIGIKKAIENKADYIFLLNQDAWIKHDTIQHLIAIQKAHPEFGIVSPIHITKDNKVEKHFYRYIKNNHELFSVSLIQKKGEVIENQFVNAAIWLLSLKCLNEVGLFNPVFSHYGEDKNYIHRCHYHGYKIGIHTREFAIHARSQNEISKFDQPNDKLNKRIKITYLGVLLNINIRSGEIILNLISELINMLKNCIARRRFLGSLFVIYNFLIIPLQIPELLKYRKITKSKSAFLK